MASPMNPPRSGGGRSLGSRLRLSRSAASMGLQTQPQRSSSAAFPAISPPMPVWRRPSAPGPFASRHHASGSASSSEYSLSVALAPPPCDVPMPELPSPTSAAAVMALAAQDNGRFPSFVPSQQQEYKLTTLSLDEMHRTAELVAGLAGVGARRAHVQPQAPRTAPQAIIGAGMFGHLPAESVSSESMSQSSCSTDQRFDESALTPSSVASPRLRTQSFNHSIPARAYGVEPALDFPDAQFSDDEDLLDQHLQQLRSQQEESLQKHPHSRRQPSARPAREREPTLRAHTSRPALGVAQVQAPAPTPIQLRRRSRSVTKIITHDAQRGSSLLSALHSPASEHGHGKTFYDTSDSDRSQLLPPTGKRRSRVLSTSGLQHRPAGAVMDLRAGDLLPNGSPSPRQRAHSFSRQVQERAHTLVAGHTALASPSPASPGSRAAPRTRRARANSHCPPATAHSVHSSPSARPRAANSRDETIEPLEPFSVLPSLRPFDFSGPSELNAAASASTQALNVPAALAPQRPPRSARRASMLLLNARPGEPSGYASSSSDESGRAGSTRPAMALAANPAPQVSRSRSPLAAQPVSMSPDEGSSKRLSKRLSRLSVMQQQVSLEEEDNDRSARASELASSPISPMRQPNPSTSPAGADQPAFRTSAYSLVAIDVASDDAESQGDRAVAVEDPGAHQILHDEEDIEWEMMGTTDNHSDDQGLDGELEWRGAAGEDEVAESFDPWDVNHERRSAIELWRQFGERYDGARPWHEEENLAAAHEDVQSNVCATDAGTVAATEAEPAPLPPTSFSPPVPHRLSIAHVQPVSAAPEPANRLSVSAFVTPTASPAADVFEFESLPPPTPAADVCGPSTPVPGAWAASTSMRSLNALQQNLSPPQDLANLASGLGINLDGTTPPPAPTRTIPFEITADADSDSSSEGSCDAFESADEGDEGVWRNRASRQSKALSWFQAADAFEKQHGCARGPSSWRTSVRYSNDCRRSIIGRPSPDSKRLSKMLAISAVRSPPQSAFIEPESASPAVSEPAPAETARAMPDTVVEEESSDYVQPETPFLTRSASLSSEEPETPATSEPVFEPQVASEANQADTNVIAWRQSFGVAPVGPAPFAEREIFSAKEARAGEAVAPRRPHVTVHPDTVAGEAYPSATMRRQSRRLSRRISTSQMPRNSAAAAENRKSVQAYRRLTAMVNATPIQLNEAPSQSSWRSSLHPRVWEQLCSQFGAKEMHRQEVIWELCATERSFVQSLCSIQRVFSLPLRTADGRWMPGVPTAAARLFDWLDDILQLHSKLSASLDRSRAAHPSPVVVQIAPSALKHVDGLVVHQPYLVRFEDVTRTIEAIIRDADSTPFGRFLEKQLRIPECSSMSLSSFLLKPVQRLMKYPLFFKQLLELTPEQHPDHATTRDLHAKTEALIRDMNNVKAREEDYNALVSLEECISGLPSSFFLATRYRKLIRQGPLRWVQLTPEQRAQLGEQRRTAHEVEEGSPVLPGRAPATGFKPLNLRSAAASRTRGDPARSSVWSNSSSATISSFSSASPSELSRINSPRPAPSPTFADGRQSPSLSGRSPSFRSDVAESAASCEPTRASPSCLAVTPQATHPTRAAPLAPPRSMNRKSSMANLFLRASSKAAARERERQTNDSAVHLQAYVFSDLVILALPDGAPADTASPALGVKGKSAKLRRNSASHQAESPTSEAPLADRFALLENVGLTRVLNVIDHSGKCAEHPFLLELEVLPIKVDGGSGVRDAQRPSGGPASFFFSFSALDENGERCKDAAPESKCTTWMRALERSLLSSIASTRRQSVMLSNPSSPALGEPDQPTTAHAEWPRRKAQVTELVMAAARSGDRTNLVALLQSGLPYPRSPSHQELADRASEVLNKTLRAQHGSGADGSTSTIAAIGDSVLDDVEEEREERRWWALRLAEVRRDMAAERDIDALAEARSAAAAARAASAACSPQLMQQQNKKNAATPRPMSTYLPHHHDVATPPKRSVRRGVPVLPASPPIISAPRMARHVSSYRS